MYKTGSTHPLGFDLILYPDQNWWFKNNLAIYAVCVIYTCKDWSVVET